MQILGKFRCNQLLLILRYEKVNFRNIRGLAKILGTVICVVGAVSMALIRGPKILNSEFSLPIAKSFLGDIKDQNLWLLGCLLVFVSTLCWSFSLIVQVNFIKHERSLLFFCNVSCFTRKLNFVTTIP